MIVPRSWSWMAPATISLALAEPSIDEQCQWDVLVASAATCRYITPRGVTTLGVHNGLAIAQELIGQIIDGRSEVAATIAPQVQHHALHALRPQLIGGLQELLVRVLGETDELDVACAILGEQGYRHAIHFGLAPFSNT